MIGRADAQYFHRATHQRQDDRVDTNWSGTKHQDGVANGNVATLNCMERGRQRASAGHKQFRLSIHSNTARARLQINLFGPTAAQPVIQSVSDAVDFSLRASRRGFRHQAIPTGVARSMHIEKRYTIALAKLIAFNVEQLPANFT